MDGPGLPHGVVRRAWTVSGGRARCVRHAVEAPDPDEMQRRDLIVEVDEAPRRNGHPDAYRPRPPAAGRPVTPG